MDVLVACQQTGVIGNTDASTVTEMVTSIAGVSAATNTPPFVNGRGQETDDDRKVRVQGYISKLARDREADGLAWRRHGVRRLCRSC